jgi:hypothetical protein
MIPTFLLDENLDPHIVYEVRRRDPAVDIVHVGERSEHMTAPITERRLPGAAAPDGR